MLTGDIFAAKNVVDEEEARYQAQCISNIVEYVSSRKFMTCLLLSNISEIGSKCWIKYFLICEWFDGASFFWGKENFIKGETDCLKLILCENVLSIYNRLSNESAALFAWSVGVSFAPEQSQQDQTIKGRRLYDQISLINQSLHRRLNSYRRLYIQSGGLDRGWL